MFGNKTTENTATHNKNPIKSIRRSLVAVGLGATTLMGFMIHDYHETHNWEESTTETGAETTFSNYLTSVTVKEDATGRIESITSAPAPELYLIAGVLAVDALIAASVVKLRKSPEIITESGA